MTKLKITVLVLLVFMIVQVLINLWSRLCCHERELDINSGQLRSSWFFAYIPLRRTISDTWVSTAVAEDLPGDRCWHPMCVTTPWASNSPHFLFHSGSFIGVVRLVSKMGGGITTDALRKLAENVIFLWKGTSSAHAASRYIEEIKFLCFCVEDPGHGGRVCELSDVPDLCKWLQRSREEMIARNDTLVVIECYESMIAELKESQLSAQ